MRRILDTAATMIARDYGTVLHEARRPVERERRLFVAPFSQDWEKGRERGPKSRQAKAIPSPGTASREPRSQEWR